MSGFRTTDFNIQSESDSDEAPRVVKTSQPVENSVQDFQMQDFHAATRKPKEFSRSGVPLTGGEPKRDQRFVLSQLAREALSVGAEEERLIQERVDQKISELEEETRIRAHEQGYAEGLKKGRDEAYQGFQEESSRRLEQLTALIESMDQAKQELFESNREFLMNVVYRIARTVLLRELSSDREYLLRLSRELIERCGLRENITLKINPSDAESIETLKQGLQQSFSTLKNLSVELSDHVGEGGCILETEWGAIDASLETQLSQILTTLDVAKGTQS